MNYLKVYKSIIDNAKLRGLNKKKLSGYYEIHHILPKCEGGLDDRENLVLLTAREHFVCHKLLVEIYPENKGLLLAVWSFMSTESNNTHNYKMSSREYEYYRLRAIDILREYGFNKIRTKEEGKKISQKAKDRWKRFRESGRVDEVKENIAKETKAAMQKKEIIEKTKVNTGSKWYTNIIDGTSMHWYKGMDIPDPNIWRPGRPPMKLSAREKLKVKCNYYYNPELKENRRFYKDDIIPEGWFPGRKPEYFGNGKKHRVEKRLKEVEEMK